MTFGEKQQVHGSAVMVVWHDGKAELVPLERDSNPKWATKKRRRSKATRSAPKRRSTSKASRTSAVRKKRKKSAKG